MAEKLAKDIQPGDVIETEEGPKRVTNVMRGMLRGSLLIDWVGGWGHVAPRASVILAEAQS